MDAEIANTEMKPAAISNIEANFPNASICPITTQIPAEKGSSKRINLKSPLTFFKLFTPKRISNLLTDQKILLKSESVQEK